MGVGFVIVVVCLGVLVGLFARQTLGVVDDSSMRSEERDEDSQHSQAM